MPEAHQTQRKIQIAARTTLLARPTRHLIQPILMEKIGRHSSCCEYIRVICFIILVCDPTRNMLPVPLYIVPLDMKVCICHFTKWQIHPFSSKETRYTTPDKANPDELGSGDNENKSLFSFTFILFVFPNNK